MHAVPGPTLKFVRALVICPARHTATLTRAPQSDARIAALEQQLSSLGGPASAASENPMYTARSAKSPAALSERWGAEELERLASAPPAAAPPAAVAVPVGAGGDAQDELRAELEELRVFCSTYLVNAAEEKVHAVEEAKAEVRAEYEVQIAALKAQLAGGAAPPPPPLPRLTTCIPCTPSALQARHAGARRNSSASARRHPPRAPNLFETG